MLKTIGAALLVTGLAACSLVVDSDTPGLRLSADRATYQEGEDVELTLANHSGRDFTVHPELCGAALQKSSTRSGAANSAPNRART